MSILKIFFTFGVIFFNLISIIVVKVTKDSGDVGVSVSDYHRLTPTAREDFFQRMSESTRIWELSDEDFYQELQSAVKEYGVGKMLAYLYLYSYLSFFLYFYFYFCFRITRIRALR